MLKKTGKTVIILNEENMLKYKIVTYGCQMNVHQSEKIAGILNSLEFENTLSTEDADIVVFNTCCIRDNAEQRAYGNIGALKPLKKQKRNLIVAVCGCMTQQDEAAEKLRAKFPFVNIILGTHNIDKIGEAIQLYLQKRRPITLLEENSRLCEGIPELRSSGTNAWIDIMYGCNNFCTYCIVPYVRGREISRPKNNIIYDINCALDNGFKEITLLGQNVNSYKDPSDNSDFAALLRDIDKISGKFRVRFMTSHPKDFNSEIIDIIKDSDKICNNIHLPVQSGSNSILKAMNRNYTREKYLQIVDEIRSKIPDCGITSDIMIGFPGETDKDFNDTVELVKKANFINAFTFVYSMRQGTPAAKMTQVDPIIKQKRITELVKIQNEISAEQSIKSIGQIYEVLCEDFSEKGENMFCGRTDSGKLVTFEGNKNDIGKFINIKIDSAHASALFGTKQEETL